MKNLPALFPPCALSLLAVGLCPLLTGCSSPGNGKTASGPAQPPPGFLLRTNYHGWADALWLSNGRVEAIIVPSIGRVMQFRLAGESDGVFWENPALLGQRPDPQSKEWANFGGDKAWPAPQKLWGNITPTNWPPPPGFDAVPYESRVDGWKVTLTSPVDPYYGIRVTRQIELDPEAPVLRVSTTFNKLEGRTLDGAVWGVTQLKDPLIVYAPIDTLGPFPQGFALMSERRPPGLEIRKGILSLRRGTEVAHKIALSTGTMIWMDERRMLRIDSPRIPLATYPDDGASAEIYTSPDPLPYVEFEALGPLHQLRRGDRISRWTTYTLLHRTEVDPELEAQKQLKR